MLMHRSCSKLIQAAVDDVDDADDANAQVRTRQLQDRGAEECIHAGWTGSEVDHCHELLT